jgi:hypothetical protein
MGNFLLLYTKYQCLVSMVLWKYKCCWNLRSVVIYLLLFGCQNCLSVTAHDILTLFITQDVVQSNLLLCQVLHYSLILPETVCDSTWHFNHVYYKKHPIKFPVISSVGLQFRPQMAILHTGVGDITSTE